MVNWYQLIGIYGLEGVVLKLATAIATLAELEDLEFDANGVLVAIPPPPGP